jgi:succinate dehydrogenase / fumarate reductase membrane anchor subunit
MGNGTPIGRVRGLGTAHEGAHHWMVQRFTAIGNLVLMSYLVVCFALLGVMFKVMYMGFMFGWSLL